VRDPRRVSSLQCVTALAAAAPHYLAARTGLLESHERSISIRCASASRRRLDALAYRLLLTRHALPAAVSVPASMTFRSIASRE